MAAARPKPAPAAFRATSDSAPKRPGTLVWHHSITAPNATLMQKAIRNRDVDGSTASRVHTSNSVSTPYRQTWSSFCATVGVFSSSQLNAWSAEADFPGISDINAISARRHSVKTIRIASEELANDWICSLPDVQAE